MAKPVPKTPAQPPHDVPRATESVSTLYANHAAIQVSVWDFKISFGQIVEASQQRLDTVDLAHVYMSPQHAKVFAMLLAKNINSYEERMGAIPIPKAALEIANLAPAKRRLKSQGTPR